MKNRLTRRIFNNFQYKIFALILACLFWYIVQGEEILEINRRIIVSIKTPDGFAIKGSDTRIKDATLRGPRVLIGSFPTKPLEATIRIPKGRKGQLRYRMDKEYIRNWDNRVKLTVHDAYVSVLVDEKATKKVPVREQLRGVPAEGYNIEKAIVKPAKIDVSGLKSEIDKIKEVVTELIDVEGIQQAKSIEAKLVTPGNMEATGLSVDKVSVNLLIGEKKVNKRFGSIPIQVVGSDFVSQVKPQYVSIVIQGTPGVLSFVKKTDLGSFVEARDLEPGRKYDREIQVKIPPDTVLIETFPENASVTIFPTKKPN
jgi:YbbR domain-containing protein